MFVFPNQGILLKLLLSSLFHQLEVYLTLSRVRITHLPIHSPRHAKQGFIKLVRVGGFPGPEDDEPRGEELKECFKFSSKNANPTVKTLIIKKIKMYLKWMLIYMTNICVIRWSQMSYFYFYLKPLIIQILNVRK